MIIKHNKLLTYSCISCLGQLSLQLPNGEPEVVNDNYRMLYYNLLQLAWLN